MIDHVLSPRPDLASDPLPNAEFNVFVDGSASRCPLTGDSLVGYAVVTSHQTLESARLPGHLSAQAAELFALIRACHLDKDQTVNIFTDSRYAFGVVHDFGTLWKHRRFLTSTGKAVQHGHLVNSLLETILLPSSVAICKCSAHTGQLDAISQGNSAADLAAKAAASAPPNTILSLHTQTACSANTETPLATIQDCQAGATPQEKANWKRDGTYSNEVWLGPSGKPCLPHYLFPY